MRKGSILQWVLLVAVVEANPARPAVKYNITDLGVLCGYDMAQAWSINNSAQIAGSVWQTYYPNNGRAVLFDPNGSGNNLALSPYESAAWQINNTGQAAGWVMNGTVGKRRAALFEPDAEPNTIIRGTLPGYEESQALSINDSNLIVGFAHNPDPPYEYHDRAALFDPSGDQNNIDLGTLPGYEYSLGFCVNNKGQIVGRAQTYDMGVENWRPRRAIQLDR